MTGPSSPQTARFTECRVRLRNPCRYSDARLTLRRDLRTLVYSAITESLA